MSVVSRLSGAAFGTHIADQTALVGAPLIAAVAFDAAPEVIGILVACQSAAHLLGSIPMGMLVDRGQLRRLAIASALISWIGFGVATASVVLGLLSLFGTAIAFAGFGTVLFGLTSLSIVPCVTTAETLAQANAALELPRAASSFVVPLFIGLLFATLPTWGVLVIAMTGSVLAYVHAYQLPTFDVVPKKKEPIRSQIRAGGAFLLRHPLLRSIALCSLFWNLAFAALLVVLVPAIRDMWMFAPGAFGVALAAFGLGAVLGSWMSVRVSNLVAPSAILLFGPASSVLAIGALLLLNPTSSELWLYTCLVLLGFGPFMWLIAQNSVRQIVSPSDMLGRVNAVIQTTIYGVRPLGALLGGSVAGAYGPQVGLTLAVALFFLSFCAAALSGLRRIRSYAALHQETCDRSMQLSG